MVNFGCQFRSIFRTLPNNQDEDFCKNSERLLVFDLVLGFTKSSILDVCQDSESSKNLQEKLHLRCLTDF